MSHPQPELAVADWQPRPGGAWQKLLTSPISTRIHIPAEDGRIFDAGQLAGTSWSGLLRAACIALEFDGQVQLFSIEDTRPAYNTFHVLRTEERLEFRWDWRLAAAVRDSLPSTPPALHENSFTELPLAWASHRAWMEDDLPASPAYNPSWLSRTPTCVMLELWAGDGTIAHTFAEVTALLKAMNARGVPPDTIVYFWGWSAPFDTGYPLYWPAPELGGDLEFSRLCATAQELGYRLMPHGNYWGCDGRLELFDRFRAQQVRDTHGNLLGWREVGEPPIEYIRPSYQPWRELYAETLHKLVQAFPLDAFFLDQMGGFADDPGCEFESASQGFLDLLTQACPTTVFGGEIIHERCRSLPLWQVWGTPWCGLPAEETKPASDLLGHLFGDHVLIGHMGTPAAVSVPGSWPAYYWYVEKHGNIEALRRANAWHQTIGALPSVRVNFRQFGLDPVAIEILRGHSD